jgi:hypothetical protein
MRARCRSAIVVGLTLGCAAAPSNAPSDAPAAAKLGTATEASHEDRIVVVAGGTPLYSAPGDDVPRGWLGSADDIGGWAMREVGREGDRIAVRAELPAGESCARSVDGLVGLGMTVWIPSARLLTVVTREVTLEAEGCTTIVARPGAVVTPLCERDGVVHYRVGNCPNADCAYAVPTDALGDDVRPRHGAATSAPRGDDSEDAIPMACLEQIDDSGAKRPLTTSRGGFLRGLPAIGISRYADAPEPGRLPSCDQLSNEALSCDVRPRLGFDHVAYEIREGAPITWRDGTPATKASEPHRFRAVPREVEGRLCWGAVEGADAAQDLELCTVPDAVHRVQDAHAVVLQTKRDGRRGRAWIDRPATDCYLGALETASDLRGRVRARYRVADGRATLDTVTGERQPGDEAFATCLAAHVAGHDDDPHVLEVVVDLFEPVSAAPAVRPPEPGAESRPSRARSPADPRR